MKYILDCINERGLQLVLTPDSEVLEISICNDEEHSIIYLDKDGLYELIGALHHIQKQIK
jgi:hypothetical protein